MDLRTLTAIPHRRYNPLADSWVLVSPQRTQRPWQGQVERLPPPQIPPYDPDCYLCPGNRRAGDRQNPDYLGTFVFENDFPALLPGRAGASPISVQGDSLFRAETERGICRVLCFSPRHDLTLALMEPADIVAVVVAWQQQFAELATLPGISYVQIFENRGAMMGASNPHPHGQIWATQHIPDIPAVEDRCQSAYLQQQGRCLLCAYLAAEGQEQARTVVENADWLVVVPFWAVWPFETLVLSKRHLPSLQSLSGPEQRSLAQILKRLTTRYDNLFETPFPYSMGWHQAPVSTGTCPHWHLHAHFYPPLLRSATVRKFMVGFEMLGMPQRDITPETAAARLRELPDTHYSSRMG